MAFIAQQHTYEIGCPCLRTCNEAAYQGDLEGLRCAHVRGELFDQDAYSYAIDGDHVDCLLFLIEIGCHCDECTCAHAAGGNHLSCLQILIDSGCPYNEEASEEAARNGHLDCLRCIDEDYKLSDATYWSPESICAAAASNEDSTCLRYLRERNYPWDEDTPYHAARSGSIKNLQYSHENDCPKDDVACSVAANCHIESCLEYVHPRSSEEQLRCLHYALRCGFPYDPSCPKIRAWKRWIHVVSVVHVCVKLVFIQQRHATRRKNKEMFEDLLSLPPSPSFRIGKTFYRFPGGTHARKALKRLQDKDYDNGRYTKKKK